MAYVGRDFDPIHPDESEVFTFDFAQDLPDGDEINSVTFSLAVTRGTDASVATRLIGSPTIIGDKVLHRVGNCLAGVIYRIEATATTAQSNTLTLYSHILCISPY